MSLFMAEFQQSQSDSLLDSAALIQEARAKTLIRSAEIQEEFENQERKEEEAETEYAYQLGALRTLESTVQSIDSLKQRGESFGKPSKIKYAVCGTIAIAKDAMEIAALAGGVTIPLAWFIGPMISFILVLIFWLFNMKVDRANEFMNDLEKEIEIIQQNIAHAVRIANRIRMIPGVKGLVKKGATTLAARASKNKYVARITKKVAGSPVAKAAWSNAIDSGATISTIFQWLPASSIGVVLSYLDERKVLKNAAENADTAHKDLSENLAITAGEIQ